MAWRWGSSGKTPALQAQSPEFKPQSHQKKKKIIIYGQTEKYLLISGSAVRSAVTKLEGNNPMP
jgi:hypothetical protein